MCNGNISIERRMMEQQWNWAASQIGLQAQRTKRGMGTISFVVHAFGIAVLFAFILKLL